MGNYIFQEIKKVLLKIQYECLEKRQQSDAEDQVLQGV